MSDWGIKVQLDGISPEFLEELRKTENTVISELADLMYETIMSYFDQSSSLLPLKDVTKWLKGSDLVLNDTGDLKRSIQVQKNGNKALVGVLIPKGSKGQDMEMIARVMEGGATIRVSAKMRGWFAWKGFPLDRGTTTLFVPPRPIFSKSMRTLDESIDKVAFPHITKLLEKL